MMSSSSSTSRPARKAKPLSSSPLDQRFLDELLEGDREFGGELFQTFELAAAQWLELARVSCQTGDREAAVRAFHTLKGSAGSVGLSELRELSLRCEQRAKEGDLSGCAAHLTEVSECVEVGRKLLAEYLEKIPG